MNIYVTLDEAAEELGLSAQEVYWLIRLGKLPGVYVSAEPHWRIRRGDLAAFMDDELE